MFSEATRKGFRYPSKVGLLTTEQLWSLPLKAVNKASLNDVAKHLYKEIKEGVSVDFVGDGTSQKTKVEEKKLEVVKYIIQWKKEVAARAAKRIETTAKKQKILAIMEKKQDQSMEDMDIDDLTKLLESL